MGGWVGRFTSATSQGQAGPPISSSSRAERRGRDLSEEDHDPVAPPRIHWQSYVQELHVTWVRAGRFEGATFQFQASNQLPSPRPSETAMIAVSDGRGDGLPAPNG